MYTLLVLSAKRWSRKVIKVHEANTIFHGARDVPAFEAAHSGFKRIYDVPGLECARCTCVIRFPTHVIMFVLDVATRCSPPHTFVAVDHTVLEIIATVGNNCGSPEQKAGYLGKMNRDRQAPMTGRKEAVG